MSNDELLRELLALKRRVMALEERARPNARDGKGAAGGDAGFWAMIGPANRVGRRWTYVWRPAVKTGTGQGGDKWVAADVPVQQAYNTIENVNGTEGFGAMGNGVSPSNLIGTFDIVPAPVGIVVWMRPVTAADGTGEFWFSYENGIDGNCPSS